MIISNHDAISLIQLVRFEPLSKIKKLDQKERKLILNAINVLNSNQEYFEVSEKRKAYLEKEFSVMKGQIENKIQLHTSPPQTNIFIKLLKWIANFFFGRIDSHKVFDELQKIRMIRT